MRIHKTAGEIHFHSSSGVFDFKFWHLLKKTDEENWNILPLTDNINAIALNMRSNMFFVHMLMIRFDFIKLGIYFHRSSSWNHSNKSQCILCFASSLLRLYFDVAPEFYQRNNLQKCTRVVNPLDIETSIIWLPWKCSYKYVVVWNGNWANGHVELFSIHTSDFHLHVRNWQLIMSAIKSECHVTLKRILIE